MSGSVLLSPGANWRACCEWRSITKALTAQRVPAVQMVDMELANLFAEERPYTQHTPHVSPPLVIETQALCKIYGQQRALDGVNLKVAPGAIGLLGPNGAGKSTFMKCLLQLQPITSGSA